MLKRKGGAKAWRLYQLPPILWVVFWRAEGSKKIQYFPKPFVAQVSMNCAPLIAKLCTSFSGWQPKPPVICFQTTLWECSNHQIASCNQPILGISGSKSQDHCDDVEPLFESFVSHFLHLRASNQSQCYLTV